LKLQIAIDGKKYEVEVEIAEDDAQPRMYPAYVPPQSSTANGGNGAPVAPAAGPRPLPAGTEVVADESKVCRSPVAGVVIRCNAQTGQQIQSNDLLLVVEAMKMETNVTAPLAGTVKSIRVQPGDGVQVGQVVVEFE
jgi:methylmalonyl-CoA carboxyltransferase small subunit